MTIATWPLLAVLGAIVAAASALIFSWFRTRSELEKTRTSLAKSAEELALQKRRQIESDARHRSTLRQLIDNAAQTEKRKAEARMQAIREEQSVPLTEEEARAEASQLLDRAKRASEILKGIEDELKK